MGQAIKLEALCDAIRKKVGCARSENTGLNHFNKAELHAILARLTILEQWVADSVATSEMVKRVAEEIKVHLTEKVEG